MEPDEPDSEPVEPGVVLRPMLVAKSKAMPARDIPDPVPRLDFFFVGDCPIYSILKIYRVDFCFM